MKSLQILFFLFTAFTGLFSQTSGERVFIHTDRKVYASSDTVHFKAYLNNPTTRASKSNRLFLCLLDPAGKPAVDFNSPVEKYQAAGALVLPDSLTEGEYRLVAYTDQMEDGSPRDAWSGKLFIRENVFPGLLISLKLDAKWYVPGESAQLSIQIIYQDGKPFSDGQFAYLACKNGVPYQNGISKTDQNGNDSFLVRIPGSQEEGLITVAVNTQFDKLSGSASILIPAGGMPVTLDFFPEGGFLVEKLNSKIAFRASDCEGNPFPFEGVILNSKNIPVDNIKSSDLGIGCFSITAKALDSLKVKITKPAGIDKIFFLPKIQNKGVQLKLAKRNAESLDFIIRSNDPAKGLQLLAKAISGGQTISTFTLDLVDSLSIQVPIVGISGESVGIILIRNDGQVVAQRTVWLGQPSPGIIIGSESGKGKKVELNNVCLAIMSPGGNPLAGTFSISVYDAVMSPEWNREPDIRSWSLLGLIANALPPGYFSDPPAVDWDLIDNLMLSLVPDITLNRTPTALVESFRNRLLKYFKPGPLESLVLQFHKDRFFNEYLLSAKPNLPSFIKNNQKYFQELGVLPGKLTPDDRIRQQLEIGVPILSIIRSIKPYTLTDNQIYFSKGKNSLEYPKGALFIIDGAEKGYKDDVLSYFSPFDIATIKVTEKISDILKYSADAGGLVLITTKKAQPDSGAGSSKPKNLFNPTLFWSPLTETKSSAPVNLSIPRPVLKTTWRMIIQGVDEKGNFLESRLLF